MLEVEGAGVKIATKDHGGEGPPLLLTHGAGGDKRVLKLLVEQLTPEFRVVTFDMRNHGQSGEGPWEWPLVSADVEAVRVAYEMDSVVVAGHSLGGMVAAIYAAAYPDHVRAAINIDGQGRGTPANYEGMTEAQVHAAWDALEEIETELLKDMSPVRLAMYDELKRINLFAVWRATPCPLLLFNCTAHDPMYEGHGEQFAEMMAAYRRGLTRDFATLAAEIPTITVANVDKTHLSVITEPAEAAQLIIAFGAN